MSKFLNQVGDTIIEVLIATALLSLVLASAFATAARSLEDIRQAQERTEALTIAENQVEGLRNASTTEAGTNIFNYPNLFCLNDIIHDSQNSPIPIGSMPPLNSTAAPYPDNLNGYSGICNFRALGYDVAIDRDDTNASQGSYLFTVHVRWYDVHGTIGHDELILTYKVDK